VAELDPVAFTRTLIRENSVTPDESGALGLIAIELERLGFVTERKTFSEDGWPDTENLYARRGTRRPNFCFAGHTDVVPVHAPSEWEEEPFAAAERDGVVYGRGAADMKSAIAAFVAATERYLGEVGGEVDGSISLLLTGDEEGPGINGTKKMLAWLQERGEELDLCLVGEPTSAGHVGDQVKNGRRGSLHGVITASGAEGHVAYPHLADNAIPKLIGLLDELLRAPLDEGNDSFQPSNLEVLDLHTDNQTDNLIPGWATARFNVRFNDMWTPESLQRELTARLDRAHRDYEIEWRVSGESFLTAEGLLTDVVGEAVEACLGARPRLSTTGGTSDARFIKDYCPVVELGMVGATMHKSNERVATEDIHALTNVYAEVLRRVFAPRPGA
jgi:succinyl-diaminopimelate desuccinylase